jgi:hypothetical protein
MLNVSCPNSLNQFNQFDLQRKKILMRFVMDGCHFCVDSQPEWDSMITTVKKRFKITPNNVISQIDSAFADEIISKNKIRAQDNTPYSINGYPDYVVVINGVATPHEKRDHVSLITTLLSNKMIVSKQKSKRKKRKQKQKRTQSVIRSF